MCGGEAYRCFAQIAVNNAAKNGQSVCTYHFYGECMQADTAQELWMRCSRSIRLWNSSGKGGQPLLYYFSGEYFRFIFYAAALRNGAMRAIF
jgi:hypothetical protein